MTAGLLVLPWPSEPADLLLTVRLAGAAVPKGRPRTGQGRTYTPEATRVYEDGVAVQVRAAMRGRPPFDGWLAARLCFALPNRDPDLDNTIKSVLDGAARGRAMRNDRQVRLIVADDVVVPLREAHTVLLLYRLP